MKTKAPELAELFKSNFAKAFATAIVGGSVSILTYLIVFHVSWYPGLKAEVKSSKKDVSMNEKSIEKLESDFDKMTVTISKNQLEIINLLKGK